MRWSLRTSRWVAATVWPLRCRDADVQRSASPSGSGRRPRGGGGDRDAENKVANCCWSISYLDYCCCFSTKAKRPRLAATSATDSTSQGMPTLRRRTAEPSTSLRPTSLPRITVPGPAPWLHRRRHPPLLSTLSHPSSLATLASPVAAHLSTKVSPRTMPKP